MFNAIADGVESASDRKSLCHFGWRGGVTDNQHQDCLKNGEHREDESGLGVGQT